MRIKDVYKTVVAILEDMPTARKDDNFLYLAVCETLCPDVVGLPFWRVFSNATDFKLVPFESVRRARQKAQADNPELKDAETSYHRAIKEEEYLKFVRN